MAGIVGPNGREISAGEGTELKAIPSIPLIGGEAGIGHIGKPLQIAVAKNLSDREILEAMAGALEGTPTVVDALAALIAEQVLEQGKKSGVTLVTAALPTVMRNIDGECFLDGEAYQRRTGRDRSQLEAATATGDWALHSAVGMGSSNGRRKFFGQDARNKAYKPVAVGGYLGALEKAENPYQTERVLAQTIKLTAPTLTRRFEDVVAVISGLLRGRDSVRDALKASGVELPTFDDFPDFDGNNWGTS